MKKIAFTTIIIPVVVLVFLAAGYLLWNKNISAPIAPAENSRPTPLSSDAQSGKNASGNSDNAAKPSDVPTSGPALSLPLSDAQDRVTKKPFGIKVSPGNSPVTPEKFSGYHTGVDFEIFPGEENIDVPVSAICSGSVLYKRWVNGYGGVLIQSCTLENQDITILYGHLRLSGIMSRVGDKIKAGEKIAVLGTGYSTETDGERKHLHLSVRKGEKIVLLGYVQNQAELRAWLDPMKYLK